MPRKSVKSIKAETIAATPSMVDLGIVSGNPSITIAPQSVTETDEQREFREYQEFQAFKRMQASGGLSPAPAPSPLAGPATIAGSGMHNGKPQFPVSPKVVECYPKIDADEVTLTAAQQERIKREVEQEQREAAIKEAKSRSQVVRIPGLPVGITRRDIGNIIHTVDVSMETRGGDPLLKLNKDTKLSENVYVKEKAKYTEAEQDYCKMIEKSGQLGRIRLIAVDIADAIEIAREFDIIGTIDTVMQYTMPNERNKDSVKRGANLTIDGFNLRFTQVCPETGLPVEVIAKTKQVYYVPVALNIGHADSQHSAKE